MAIFYQHIGEKLWPRDVPRTIGTPEDGLKRFKWVDVERDLSHLEPYEEAVLRDRLLEFAPNGAQIWGIPSGARAVLNRMRTGDFLMLLESEHFGYVGQVLHFVQQPCHDLSRHLWGEDRFPLIIFLQGELVNYGWDTFKEHFGYAPALFMRGNTSVVAAAKVAASPSQTEEAFIAEVLSTAGLRTGLESDFRIFANNLQVHFRLVRERDRQQSFRADVLAAQGARCAVCDISIPAVLEAAHVVPKQHDGTDDPRNGLALCVSHHRMFDAHLFGIVPDNYCVQSATGANLEELRITRANITHLSAKPHPDALAWRWEEFEARAGTKTATRS